MVVESEVLVPEDIDIFNGLISDKCTPDGQVRVSCHHVATLTCKYVRMFGWEKEMNTRIADKREEELKKLWIRRLLDMTSGMLKSVVLNVCVSSLTFCASATRFPLSSCL
jgi:hypothetical protein